MIVLLHLSVFLSAFLLFQIELVLSKALLPVFGGSYLVWSVSVMLFQGLLLLGYAYAHFVLKRLHGSKLRLLQLFVVFMPLLLFPLSLANLSSDGHHSSFVFAISAVLLTTIGPAFFALSSLSVMLQGYLAASRLPQRVNPYLLYATSNVGSFSGLLSYPFLVEPLLDLEQQLDMWQCGYLLLAALFALLTWGFMRLDRGAAVSVGADAALDEESAATDPGFRERLSWLLYAAAGSAMFLAVTNVVTFDIAAVPLIWVLPLCLYLASFVLTFKRRPFYPPALRRRFPLVAAIGVFLFFLLLQSYKLPVLVLLGAHLCVLFVICIICHGELHRLKPENAKLLPGFYLILSLGGFCGSLLVSWVLPLTTDSLLEYCTGFVLLALGLALNNPLRGVRISRVLLAFLVVPVLLGWGLLASGAPTALTTLIAAGAGILLALIFYGLQERPIELALCLLFCLFAAAGMDSMATKQHLLLKHRNFYGIYRVYDQDGKRFLKHGTTLHGKQYLEPSKQHIAMTYYHASGPAGRLLRSPYFHFKSVAVIGLGAGSLAVYARPGQRFDFYELDPYNELVARRYFTFLEQSKGDIGLIFGDARLSLASPEAPVYGTLLVDAFNSDSIPVHLITVEAIALYLQHVQADGPVVFHISNKFMDLAPVLYANARVLGLRMVEKRDLDNGNPDKRASIWAALCRDKATADVFVHRLGWQDAATLGLQTVRPWTDRFSNILSVLQKNIQELPLAKLF